MQIAPSKHNVTNVLLANHGVRWTRIAHSTTTNVNLILNKNPFIEVNAF